MIDISVCLIFRAEDARYLRQCQESLPAGVEICAVQCVESPGVTTRFRIVKEESFPNGTVVRQAIYQYPRNGFRFDTARNCSLRLASRGWILALDADERLIEHQWSDWVQATEEAPANVGGLTIGVWGAIPRGHGAMSRHNGGQIRLFRNSPAIYFRKRVHEFFGLEETIREAGYKIAESTLSIHHVGYETSREALLEKCGRNIRLCCQELAVDPDQPDIQQKLYDTLRLQSELRGQ